jgi:hypothetical protein
MKRRFDWIENEVRENAIPLRQVEPFDRAFHAALAQTLTEWSSLADEEAFRDL